MYFFKIKLNNKETSSTFTISNLNKLTQAENDVLDLNKNTQITITKGKSITTPNSLVDIKKSVDEWLAIDTTNQKLKTLKASLGKIDTTKFKIEVLKLKFLKVVLNSRLQLIK